MSIINESPLDSKYGVNRKCSFLDTIVLNNVSTSRILRMVTLRILPHEQHVNKGKGKWKKLKEKSN